MVNTNGYSNFNRSDPELVSNFELRVSDFRSSWSLLAPPASAGYSAQVREAFDEHCQG